MHRENINAHSGHTIYLAPGAVIFGSLNLWQVHAVRVLGRGMIVYDGPQNPNDDEGWMHKPDWHCIVMDNASNIEIDGITCIVRRTWQIQMRESPAPGPLQPGPGLMHGTGVISTTGSALSSHLQTSLDGGYTFYLLTSSQVSFTIDSFRPAPVHLRARRCAVQQEMRCSQFA